VHIKELLKEYKKADNLTAVLIQTKIKLQLLGKLKRKRIREHFAEKGHSFFAEWKELLEEAEEELLELESRRKRKYGRFKL